ncbi:MAG: sugar transferase [Filifactoraceae bacterium]
MKSKKTYRNQTIIETISLLGYILLSILSLYIAQFFDRVILKYNNIIDMSGVIPWIIIFALLFTSYFKCYSFASKRFLDLIYSTYLSVFAMNMAALILPYFGFQFKISKKILLLNLFIQFIIMTLWLLWSRRLYFKIVPPLKTILISDNHGDEIKSKINGGGFKYKINEILLGSDPDLLNKLSKAEAIAVDNVDEDIKKSIISYCLDKEIPYISRPSYKEIILKESSSEQFGDMMMLVAKTRGLNIIERGFKRITDFVIALIGIIITGPIIVWAAYRIKRQDGMNPFFSQKRLTKDGETFNCYKLRTMIPDAEKVTGAILAEEGDSRITPFGQKLRDTRIDELPQLINVLKGEMSIVGPRAEREIFYKEYEKTLPEFRHRLGVKAGITGYAQVYGRYDTSPKDKLMMDLMYIQTYSPLLDLRVVVETVMVIFDKRVY